MKKKFLAFFTAMLLMTGTFSANVMAAEPALEEVSAKIQTTANYLASETPVDSITISKYKTVVSLLLGNASNADVYAQAFIDSVVADNLTEDGKITMNTVESPFGYAYVLQVLARAGVDATNFHGHNLVENFEACLAGYDAASLRTFVDTNWLQYNMPVLMYTIKGYSDELANEVSYMEILKDVILSYYEPHTEYGYALDLFGWDTYSADDSGSVLTALKDFYATDSEVAEKIDATMALVQGMTTPEGTITSVGMGTSTPNSSSTGLGLAFYSAFDFAGKDILYAGLETFRSTSGNGAYFANTTDNDDDPYFSTPDALTGLITYERMASKAMTIFELGDTSMGMYETVIQKINALPVVITLSDKAALDEIAMLYNALSGDFKSKITNYNIYLAAVTAYDAAYAAANTQVSTTTPAKTADSSVVWLYVILMAVSTITVVYAGKKRILN